MERNAIIFDVDGTLWDSCQSVANAWNIVFDRYKELNGKTVTAEQAKSFMGKTSEEIFSTLLPDLEEQKMLSIMIECGKEEEVEIAKNGGKLFKNLEKTFLEIENENRIYKFIHYKTCCFSSLSQTSVFLSEIISMKVPESPDMPVFPPLRCQR